MNPPNAITLARLLSVPLTIWLILQEAWSVAFGLFVLAGVSDAVDGFIAKRFNMRTDLGRFLDPLADKALLVSIYVALGMKGQIPAWLVILVVSRDVLIIGGALLAFAMGAGMKIEPLPVSKVNTVAQIALAAVVLGNLSLVMLPATLVTVLVWLVGATTVLSGASYLIHWSRGQSSGNGGAAA
ncbi:MAG TPA: CDP-alcohol phosphatidyltransferase family protein [Candidatus Sulfotelmatobacter sp.]|nr:CDP-alcohol phosphatidyltransferase family protein [Candidatus Sulfotelmatobacter sp.]